MNYRRGVFRLWVILAVLWIGGVAWMSGPNVYQGFVPASWPGTPMLPVKCSEARGDPSDYVRGLEARPLTISESWLVPTKQTEAAG
jgi:hypothetical protein